SVLGVLSFCISSRTSSALDKTGITYNRLRNELVIVFRLNASCSLEVYPSGKFQYGHSFCIDRPSFRHYSRESPCLPLSCLDFSGVTILLRRLKKNREDRSVSPCVTSACPSEWQSRSATPPFSGP